MVAIGTQLGRHRLLDRLGAGAMGEVFRAQDVRLDRQVAVKVLSEKFSEDPDRLARFEREAKAVAALAHPSILVLYRVALDRACDLLVAGRGWDDTGSNVTRTSARRARATRRNMLSE